MGGVGVWVRSLFSVKRSFSWSSSNEIRVSRALTHINIRFVISIKTIKNIVSDVLGIKGGSKKSKFIDYTPKLLHIIFNRGSAFFIF